MDNSNYRVGDVFQINEKHGRNGLIGSFVLATEIKTWGIQGFVHNIDTFDSYSRIYLRLKYDELDLIGHTDLLPSDECEEADA
jgi:hypothetical protein